MGERLVADALSKLHQHEVEIEALLDGANAELANEQDEAQVEIAAPLEALHEAWKTLVMNSGDVSANYIKHLVERVEIDGQHIRVVPRSEFVGAEDVAFREPGVESLPEVTPNTEPKLSTAERRARSAAEVRAVMEAEGLTRAQVARRFGWSRAWITKLLGRAPRRRTSVNRPVAERRQTLPVGEGQHATRA